MNPNQKSLRSWSKWPCFPAVGAAEVRFRPNHHPLFSLIVVQADTALVVAAVEVEAEEAVAVGEVVAAVVAASMVEDSAAVGEEDTEEEDATGGKLRSIAAIRVILHHWYRFGSVL